MVQERFWEIDVLRGIAVVLMVIFNYSFALSFLNIYSFNGGWLYWSLFPRLVASMFILLVGLSLTLFYNQMKNKKPEEVRKKNLLRGLEILGFGVLITVVTFLTFPQAFIVFGILHFIGISIILGLFFVKFRKLNLFLGLLVIALGVYLQGFRFDFSWLLWLGFVPKSFYTFDYFPLLPWFGVVLIGIFFGNLLYTNGKRHFRIKNLSEYPITKQLSFLGRHSLAIYLIHQPIFVLLLVLLGFNVLAF